MFSRIFPLKSFVKNNSPANFPPPKKKSYLRLEISLNKGNYALKIDGGTQTDRKANRQKDRKTDRQKGKQTDRKTKSLIEELRS